VAAPDDKYAVETNGSDGWVGCVHDVQDGATVVELLARKGRRGYFFNAADISIRRY
jgi:hypothetical protein